MAGIPEVASAAAALPSPFIDRVRDAMVWHLLLLESVDNSSLQEGKRITGQFPLQQGSHSISAEVPDASGFSRSHPLVQWVGGAAETFTFQARLFSEHSEDFTATDKFELLKLMCNKSHAPLNRPPLARFYWGNAIPGGMPCFVQSIGGVSYDEIRPDGSLRGVTLNISIKKYVPFQVTLATVSPTDRTPTHTVRDGETYEMIAHRRWGDPMLGIPLRQQNPRFPMEKWAPRGVADLARNEVIKLFPRRDLDSTPIKPQCHIFDENSQASAENRRYFFSIRGLKTAIIPRR